MNRSLLDHDTSDENIADFEGNPLFIACEHGKVNDAREIIQLKPELAWGRRSQDGYGLMHFSCENGHIKVVKALAELEPDLCHQIDNDSTTPLHIAAINGNEGIIRALIGACPASLRRVTSLGETALQLALKNNQCACFDVLMEELQKHSDQEAAEELLNWMDHEGNTVFHIATSHKQVQILKLLLQPTNGPAVEINSRNKQGFTALDLLFRNFSDAVDKHISRLLHEAGAKEGHALCPSSCSQLPESTKMMLASMSSMTKSVLLAVFIFIGGAAYACLFSLNTIYPPQDHAGLAMLSVEDIISAPHLLPDVFYFMVFNTLTFMGSMIVILSNTWSLLRKWSLCFRAVPLFVMAAMFMSYALIVKKILPKFWVRIGTCNCKISSFWLVWLLYDLPLILFILTLWFIVKQLLCIFPERRKGRPRYRRTTGRRQTTNNFDDCSGLQLMSHDQERRLD